MDSSFLLDIDNGLADLSFVLFYLSRVNYSMFQPREENPGPGCGARASHGVLQWFRCSLSTDFLKNIISSVCLKLVLAISCFCNESTSIRSYVSSILMKQLQYFLPRRVILPLFNGGGLLNLKFLLLTCQSKLQELSSDTRKWRTRKSTSVL